MKNQKNQRFLNSFQQKPKKLNEKPKKTKKTILQIEWLELGHWLAQRPEVIYLSTLCEPGSHRVER